jgi:hypothetical protein
VSEIVGHARHAAADQAGAGTLLIARKGRSGVAVSTITPLGDVNHPIHFGNVRKLGQSKAGCGKAASFNVIRITILGDEIHGVSKDALAS